MGARLSGAIELERKVSGEVTADRRRLTATTKTERPEVNGKITLLTRALWWKTEDSWEITLMEKLPPEEHGPWVLLDLS